MENRCHGFLAMVKCFSTRHLLPNNIIHVTFYMLYRYGLSSFKDINIEKNRKYIVERAKVFGFRY